MELNDFSLTCRNCILLNSGSEIGLCASTPASRFDTNYGLMLLSRKELKNTNVALYNSQSQFRAYLEASVSVLLLFCLHIVPHNL